MEIALLWILKQHPLGSSNLLSCKTTHLDGNRPVDGMILEQPQLSALQDMETFLETAPADYLKDRFSSFWLVLLGKSETGNRVCF